MKMKSTEIPGVYKFKNKIFTENPKSCKGIKIYNERLIKLKEKEFRAWNPYRSKLASAIINGLLLKINPNSNVLYLGAATGTTVSHISDILKEGTIFSVESSPIAVKKLLEVSEKRKNIIPILEDANHPDRYNLIVPIVDVIYQDISQRNQAEIFIENIRRYLKKDGYGIIMVKARSIDVALEPKKAFDLVCSKLEKSGLKILKKINLNPYEKDHAAIMVSM
jgi:fibrillarin-like pre-rRNA processing protein